MTFKDLKAQLDPAYRKLTKAEFVAFITDSDVDGRVRVGGPTGKGRITAKRAAALLSV